MSGGNDLSATDAAEMFLNEWKTEDAALSSPDDQEDEDPDNSENDAEGAELPDAEGDDETVDEQSEADGEGADDEGDEDVAEARYAEDTDKIKYRFNGEEVEVSVADIKRLAGQERSLDGRSKDLAENERKVNDSFSKAEALSQALYERALERFKPFENMNWLLQAKEMDSEAFVQLQHLANAHYQDVAFYGEGLQRSVDERRQRDEQAQEAAFQQRALATMEELSNPTTGIKDFNPAKIQEIGNYAQSMGIPADRMRDLVHAPILRILEKARLYDAGQAAKTTPVVKTPKKIIKQRVNVDTTRAAASNGKANKAHQKLSQSGGYENAVNAFMADWTTDD